MFFPQVIEAFFIVGELGFEGFEDDLFPLIGGGKEPATPIR